MIKVTLKDGVVREYEKGVSALKIAESLGAGLYKAACACKIDGETADLRTPLEKDCSLEILTFDDDEGKRALRHTASHVLAQAVKRLYPDAKLAIGPAVENGFYYDFDVKEPFTPEDVENIEKEMGKIVKEAVPLERYELEPDEAIKLMREKGEDYKVELIKEHSGKGEKISFYRQGEFDELCAGPHVPDAGRVKAFKLVSCTGAYWRGDSKNKALQRIYGTAFTKKADLDAYLTAVEEAKKRDHRKLGRELELFAILDEGPGFPFFLPNGMILRNVLLDYWREVHKRYGYVEISTPILLNRGLWERSGHWEHYKENMYTTVIDDEDFAIKPMNCPGGMLVYKLRPHSYKELPLRLGEIGLVHRHELGGALHGLFRLRCFTQDDAHIFMAWDQMKDEVKNVVRLFDEVYSTFGLKYKIELSTMPEDHMGDEKVWDFATETLKAAIIEAGKGFVVNEGDGAFYGPKLDFHLSDSLGRTWQCGTIQLDMQLPERFELEYIDADDKKRRPAMIHRVVLGSIERFIGIITEHFAGAFPLWLAPEQVRILPIADRHIEYARKVRDKLEAAGLRTGVDERSEKIGYKIREAQLNKVPFMLLAGDKEIENGTIAVRKRGEGDLGASSLEDFASGALADIKNKKIW